MRDSFSRVAKTIMIMFTLSGCGTNWYKPGATNNEFNLDKDACNAFAYSQAPINNVKIPIGQSYTTQSTTNCSQYYNQINCTTNPGQYVAAPTFTLDQNEGARTTAFKRCMHYRGWSEQQK